MKFNWKRYSLIGALIFGTLLSERCVNVQTENKKISFADSINSELQKYPTATHLIYEIQKSSEENFSDIGKLERITRNVESKFPKKESYSKNEVVERLETINKEIKLLGLIPKENKFDCDDLAFIYLGVGEKLNLNLFGVLAPEHLFIRYDSDGKHDALNSKNPVNKDDFNWETTLGKEFNDRDYIEKFKIQRKLIEKGIFLKNLTKLELISEGYSNKGNSLHQKGEYSLAIENYNKAIELYPDDPDFYFNKQLAERLLKK